jgi:hypothetical protein
MWSRDLCAAPAPAQIARLGACQPLLYDLEPARLAELDLDAHVRAASGLRAVGNEFVVLQDDVSALALAQRNGRARPLLLPIAPGAPRRFSPTAAGKRGKLDLEALLRLPDQRLLALASGSRPTRERIALGTAQGDFVLLEAPELYAALRACQGFAGSELNLEGAELVADRVRLLQRGNGAKRAGCGPHNAWLDLDLGALLCHLEAGGPLPALGQPTRCDLGREAGVPLGFTDAARAPDGRLCFLAAAEASDDAVDDGACLGSWIGWFEGSALRVTRVLEPDGQPTRRKLEGLDFAADGAWVCADPDDPERPALLSRLELPGW